MQNTFVLICLGNFDKEYMNTRHNFGFMLFDFISEKLQIPAKDIKYGQYLYFEHTPSRKSDDEGSDREEKRRVFVFRGKTYMNLSGIPARRFAESFGFISGGKKTEGTQFLVAHDDLDIPFGRIKIVEDGGAGGHRGVLSIIEHLGKDSIRIKMGIGRPKEKNPEAVSYYVLSEFSKEEKKSLQKILEACFDAFFMILNEGVSKAMSVFNSKDVLQSH